MPDLPGGSSAAPTLYQTMWVTTGARWSGMTTTSRPLARLKLVTLGAKSGSAAGRNARGREGGKEDQGDRDRALRQRGSSRQTERESGAYSGVRAV